MWIGFKIRLTQVDITRGVNKFLEFLKSALSTWNKIRRDHLEIGNSEKILSNFFKRTCSEHSWIVMNSFKSCVI